MVSVTRVLGSLWSLVVIHHLLDGPKGFNELLRSIEGMNAKTLSRTLKSLRARGLVVRNVTNTQPFSVEYSLTPMALELNEILVNLQEWGEKWLTPAAIRKVECSGDTGHRENSVTKREVRHTLKS